MPELSESDRETDAATARFLSRASSSQQLDARHLGAIIESGDVGVFAFDLDGVFTAWSVAAERLYGYAEEEVIGQSVLGLIPHDRKEEFEFILRTVSAGNTVRDLATQRRHKDGRLLDVVLSASAVRDDAGNVVGAAGFIRDASRLSDYQQRLRLYAEAIDASPVGMVIFQPERTRERAFVVRVANKLARHILSESGLREGESASVMDTRNPIVPVVLEALAVSSLPAHAPLTVDVAGEERVLVIESVKLADGAIAVMMIDSTDALASEREREELLTRLTENEDLQRKRIAEGIHDNALQILAGINIELGSLRRQKIELSLAERVGRIESQIRTVATELRSLVFELFPTDLEKEGLGLALERLAKQFTFDDGPRIELKVDLPGIPPLSVVRTAYRIFQEGLANARKHAQASQITLLCFQEGGVIVGAVIDDGIGLVDGFPRSQPGHLGLRTVSERVALAGGSVRLSQNGAHGARLEFSLPLA